MASSVTSNFGQWLRRQQRTELVNTLRDEHQRVQAKTFTKWINSFLLQCEPPVLVRDLFVDIRDGLLLLTLLEVLSKQTLRKERGAKGRVQHLENIRTALKLLEDRKIRLVNINPSDIADGKPTIVLGLIWTIILYFQIEETTADESQQASNGDGQPHPKENAKTVLLKWADDKVSKLLNAPVPDFSSSWRDGMAFNALVHTLDPNAVDLDSVKKMESNRLRLDNAFDAAEKNLSIPRLLDAEDVDVLKPDERSIMTYVAQFMKVSKDMKQLEDDSHVNEQLKLSRLRAEEEKRDSKNISNWLDSADARLPARIDQNTAKQNDPRHAQLKEEADKLAPLYGKLLDRRVQGSLLGIGEAEVDDLRGKWDQIQGKLADWDQKLAEKAASEKAAAEKFYSHSYGLLKDWVTQAEHLSKADPLVFAGPEALQACDAAIAQLPSALEDFKKAQEALDVLSPALSETELPARVEELKDLRDRLAALGKALPEQRQRIASVLDSDRKLDSLLKPVSDAILDQKALLATPPVGNPSETAHLRDLVNAIEIALQKDSDLKDSVDAADGKLQDFVAVLPAQLRPGATDRLKQRVDAAKKDLANVEDEVKKKRNHALFAVGCNEAKNRLDRVDDDLDKVNKSLESGSDSTDAQKKAENVLREIENCAETVRKLGPIAANCSEETGKAEEKVRELAAEVDARRDRAEKLAKVVDEEVVRKKAKKVKAEAIGKNADDKAKAIAAEINDILAQLARLDEIPSVEERVKLAKKLNDRLNAARKAAKELLEEVANEAKAAGLDPNTARQLQDRLADLINLDAQAAAAQAAAETKQKIDDSKLAVAKKATDDAQKEMEKLKDEIGDVEKQLATLSTILPIEDRCRLAKSLNSRLNKAKAAQKGLKEQLEKDMLEVGLNPSEVAQFDPLTKDFSKQDARIQAAKNRTQAAVDALEAQVEHANQVANRTSNKLQQLSDEVADLQKQLENSNNIKSPEERKRVLKELARKLDKNKKLVEDLLQNFTEELESEGTKPESFQVLLDLQKQLDTENEKIKQLKDDADSKFNSLSSQMEKAAEIAAKLKEKMQPIEAAINDAERKVEDVKDLKTPEEQSKVLQTAVAKLHSGKRSVGDVINDFENELQGADLAAEQFPCLLAAKKSLQSAATRLGDVEEDAGARLKTVQDAIERARQIAVEIAPLLAKQQEEVRELQSQFDSLDTQSSADNKKRLAKELSDKLNDSKKSLQAVREKMENEGKLGSGARRLLELEEHRRTLTSLDNQIANLKDSVDQQLRSIDDSVDKARQLLSSVSTQLRQIEVGAKAIDEKIQSLDNIKVAADRNRLAKEQAAKARLLSVGYADLKRKFNEAVANADNAAEKLPELATLADEMGKIGRLMDKAEQEAEAKSQSIETLTKRVIELTEWVDKQTKKLEVQASTVKSQLNDLNAIKSPEVLLKHTAEIVVKCEEISKATKLVKEEFESRQNEADLLKANFGDIDDCRKDLEKLDETVARLKTNADEKLQLAQKQVDKIKVVVDRYAQLREPLESDIGNLAKQSIDIESAAYASEKLKLLQEMGAKLEVAKKQFSKISDGLQSDLESEGVSSESTGIRFVRDEIVEQVKLSSRLKALSDDFDVKTEEANAELLSAKARLKTKVESLSDRTRNLKAKSSQLDGSNLDAEPKSFNSALKTLESETKALKHDLLSKLQLIARQSDLTPIELHDAQSQLTSMQNQVTEIEKLTKDRLNFLEKLSKWKIRAKDVQTRLSQAAEKVANESESSDESEVVHRLKRDAEDLEDDFRKLSADANLAQLSIRETFKHDPAVLATRLSNLESEVKAKQAKSAQSSKELSDFEAEVGSLERSVQSFTARVGNLRISPFGSSAVDQCGREAAKLQAELDALNGSFRNLKQQALSLPLNTASDRLLLLAAPMSEARSKLRIVSNQCPTILDSFRQVEQALVPISAYSENTLAFVASSNVLPANTAEFQLACESLRKKEAEVLKQKAMFDVIQIKIEFLAQTASSLPVTLVPAEVDARKKLLMQQLAEPVLLKLDAALATLSDCRRKLEAQNVLNQHLKTLNHQMACWLKATSQALEDALESTLNHHLTRYRDELPHYEGLLREYRLKKAELDSVSGRSDDRRQLEGLESAFSKLKELAKVAEEKVSLKQKQVSKLADSVKQLVSWLNEKNEWVSNRHIQLATQKPEEQVLVDAYESVQRVQHEIDQRVLEINSLVQQASTQNSTESIACEAQAVQRKVMFVKERFQETLALISSQLKLKLLNECGKQSDWLVSQQEILLYCGAIVTPGRSSAATGGEDSRLVDNAESIETKKRNLVELLSRIPKGETEMQRLRSKLESYKGALPQVDCTEVEKLLVQQEEELKKLKGRAELARKNLNRASDKMRSDRETPQLPVTNFPELGAARRQASPMRLSPRVARADLNGYSKVHPRFDSSTQTICEVSTQTDYKSNIFTQTSVASSLSDAGGSLDSLRRLTLNRSAAEHPSRRNNPLLSNGHHNDESLAVRLNGEASAQPLSHATTGTHSNFAASSSVRPGNPSTLHAASSAAGGVNMSPGSFSSHLLNLRRILAQQGVISENGLRKPIAGLSRSLQTGLDVQDSSPHRARPRYRSPQNGKAPTLLLSHKSLPYATRSSVRGPAAGDSRLSKSQLLPFATTMDRELMAYEPGAWQRDPKYKHCPSTVLDDIHCEDQPKYFSCCQLDREKHRTQDYNGHCHDNAANRYHSLPRRNKQHHSEEDSLEMPTDENLTEIESSRGHGHSYDTEQSTNDRCSRAEALSKIVDSLHDLHKQIGTYGSNGYKPTK